MIHIKASQIEAHITVCPYCMTEVDPDTQGHCGESSGHMQLAVVTQDETYLLDDIYIEQNQ